MTIRKWLLLACVLIGIVAFTGGPRAQAPTAAFYGIGDLPGGGVGSAVRDATLVGGTIYAVGSSATASAAPFPQLDTPALWTGAGSGSGTLAALPAGTGVATNAIAGQPFSAYAITSWSAYIASQTR